MHGPTRVATIVVLLLAASLIAACQPFGQSDRGSEKPRTADAAYCPPGDAHNPAGGYDDRFGNGNEAGYSNADRYGDRGYGDRDTADYRRNDREYADRSFDRTTDYSPCESCDNGGDDETYPEY